MVSGTRIRCVIHGSFRRHLAEISAAAAAFRAVGIEVVAPDTTNVVDETDGFVYFEGEAEQDPREIELKYLLTLKHLGPDGFSYFVAPDGYLGRTASYELGVAQGLGLPCYLSERPKDHPVWLPANVIWPATELASFVAEHGHLPRPRTGRGQARLAELARELPQVGTKVASGGIIRYCPRRGQASEVLLVRTHKWGGRWSVVGGKLRLGETVRQAFQREIMEETGLAASVGRHLCTFDQLRGSGYWLRRTHHLFVDFVADVSSRKVILNDEAQEYVWITPHEALAALDIEPNALKTLRLYEQSCR